MPEAVESPSTSYSAMLTSMAVPLMESTDAACAGLLPSGVCGNLLWIIYLITCRISGRRYVGVTRRKLVTRVAGHDLLARRRPDLGRPGSLLEAIRHAYNQGLSFSEAFTIRVLAQTSDPNQARDLERHWIAHLQTAAPHGFNLMPGGSSLGGPGNAEPVSIRHRERGDLTYASLMDAVADLNRERQQNGKMRLSLRSVYARRALGWTIEEALELKPHADRRRQRPLFRWHGRVYRSLHDLARKEGWPTSTVRSRLHRARLAGCGTSHDAAIDRRAPGPWRRDGVECGRLPPLVLPHPRNPDASPVSATTFANLANLPKATVLHRYHRLRGAAADLSAMTRADVLAALMRREERRVLITLPVPQGPVLHGGVREVIRQVLTTPGLDRKRPERLGFSAIRARLRAVPGWPDRMAPEAVRRAFGFPPGTARTAPSMPTV